VVICAGVSEPVTGPRVRRRGLPPPAIEESLIPGLLEASAPAAHRAIRTADDLGRLHPADRPTHCAQNDSRIVMARSRAADGQSGRPPGRMLANDLSGLILTSDLSGGGHRKRPVDGLLGGEVALRSLKALLVQRQHEALAT
jgi:hypothetical protein